MRVIVQQFQPGKWSVPCVKYSRGRFPGDCAESPEIYLFGRDYLGSNHWHLLDIRPGPLRDTFVTTLDMARTADLPCILERIAQKEGTLKLMSADELRNTEFLNFPNGSNLQSAAIYAACAPSDTSTPLIPPWTCAGWAARARNWIVAILQSVCDISEEDIVVSVSRSWELGCTAFVTNANGPGEFGVWWFKASPSRRITAEYPATEYDKSLKFYFSEEAMLMKHVSENFANLVPRLVAIDRDRGFMLMTDGGRQFSRRVPRGVKATLVVRYVEMQKASATRIETLLEIGCYDRRLHLLSEQLRKALAETRIPRMPDFEQYYAKFEEFLQIVQEYSGPYAAVLVHGDMHNGNVLYNWNTATAAVIDWSDGCVAHPLIDFPLLVEGKSISVEQYLALFDFPQRAVSDARLLSLVHNTVTACGIADSCVDGSETARSNGRGARFMLRHAKRMLSGGCEDQAEYAD